MTTGTDRREIRERFESETLLALMMEEGATCQQVQTAPKSGKCKEMDSVLEPPGGRPVYKTLSRVSDL